MQLTTIEIMGGLGNQLFQIFALLAYSLRHKSPFFFAKTGIQHGQRKTLYWDTDLLKAIQPFVKTPPPQVQFQIESERGFDYSELRFDAHGQTRHVRLFGYFQSYKYFADQQEEIFRLLKLRETQAKIKAKTSSTYHYEKTIAVHFRVGDYAQLPNHHPLMTLEYYTQALTHFLQAQAAQQAAQQAQKSPSIDINRAAALFETADEAIAAQASAQAPVAQQAPSWNILYFCEQNDQTYVETQIIKKLQEQPEFKDKFSFQCIDHNLPDWEQLIVMSLCQNHIIANSTFSWWGAYLGGQDDLPSRGCGCLPQGLPAYYPTTWFGPAMGYKNMSDLFPANWHRINV